MSAEINWKLCQKKYSNLSRNQIFKIIISIISDYKVLRVRKINCLPNVFVKGIQRLGKLLINQTVWTYTRELKLTTGEQ